MSHEEYSGHVTKFYKVWESKKLSTREKRESVTTILQELFRPNQKWLQSFATPTLDVLQKRFPSFKEEYYVSFMSVIKYFYNGMDVTKLVNFLLLRQNWVHGQCMIC